MFTINKTFSHSFLASLLWKADEESELSDTTDEFFH